MDISVFVCMMSLEGDCFNLLSKIIHSEYAKYMLKFIL